MVWDSSWTESIRFCVTGSSSVLNIGSKISLYRSITASSSRVAWVDMLNSSMTEFALARVSMPCSHQRAKFHLAGSKVYDWLNGHYKFGNKVTFHPVFHTRYIFSASPMHSGYIHKQQVTTIPPGDCEIPGLRGAHCIQCGLGYHHLEAVVNVIIYFINLAQYFIWWNFHMDIIIIFYIRIHMYGLIISI